MTVVIICKQYTKLHIFKTDYVTIRTNLIFLVFKGTLKWCITP